MTEIELCFYERLGDEIDSRAYKICKELNILYRSTYEVFVANGKIIINIIDDENACIDHLRMTFEEFSSNNYLEEAKKSKTDIYRTENTCRKRRKRTAKNYCL